MTKKHRAFEVGDVLDKLERSAKEMTRCIDSRGRLDVKRLQGVRENVAKALGEIDGLIAASREDG